MRLECSFAGRVYTAAVLHGGQWPPVEAGSRIRAVHRGEQEVGTFTSFAFGQTKGDKIDYVLVQPGTTVLDASIVRTAEGGHYPSDHFPVTARIQLAR